MKLDQSYNQTDFLSFLSTFLPDFVPATQSVNATNCKIVKQAESLGVSEELELQVFELSHSGTHQKRVALANDGFRLMKETGNFRALIAYKSLDNDAWRLSLMTATPIINDGRVITKLSNPRRFSYSLGPSSKVVTPHKFLMAKGKIKDFDDLISRFSVEVVNNEFYKEIAKLYDQLVGTDKVVGLLKHPDEEELKHEFAVRLIGRIIFAWFLREKVGETGKSLINRELLSSQAAETGDYYHTLLAPLFFEVLNYPLDKRKDRFQRGIFADVPYLNGGLFTPQTEDYYRYDEDLERSNSGIIDVPDQWIRDLFNLLELYNFTVDENTAVDIDLSIDPEMLGRIFENLLARINPQTGETVRRMTGSFYTPREIVEYMVDESLVRYLQTATRISENKLRALVSYDLTDDINHPLTAEEQSIVVDMISKVTVLDPACGSGAFPIGILQKIVFILQQIDPDAKLWFEKQVAGTTPEIRNHLTREFENKNFDYLRKLGIIRTSIFGVDIQPIATEIARLRCFLTLIVDEQVNDNEPNRGVEPLPNLDFKFVTANSLIFLPDSNNRQSSLIEDKISIEELKELRDEYFTAGIKERKSLQSEFQSVQMKMLRWIIDVSRDRDQSKMTSALSDWDPFSHKVNKWFDPEWMFGIGGGFDIVIANPPYDVLDSKYNQLIEYVRENSSAYSYALGGKLNLYRLFIERSAAFLNTSGTICFIVPSTLIADKSTAGIRRLFKEKLNLYQLIEFPERSKVFESVTQATTIFVADKEDGSGSFSLAINLSSKNLPPLTFAEVSWDEVELLFGENLTLPLIKSQFEFNLLQKIYSQESRLKNVATCYQGDINLTFDKAMLASTPTRTILVRGEHITPYEVDLSSNISDRRWYSGSIGGIKGAHQTRIVCQQVVNMGLNQRIVAAKVADGIVVGNSANCIEPRTGVSIDFLLGLLNSKLLNWAFKKTSTNNHVNVYELELLPIAIDANESLIADAVRDLRGEERQVEVNKAVYQLYDLTPEEIKIIESQN